MLNTFVCKLRLNSAVAYRPVVCQWTRDYRKFWPEPPNLRHIELPPEAERPLMEMQPSPSWHGVRPQKWPRQMHDIRGPELVNNQLIHKQFGIIALTGFQLAINHMNLIRTVVNKHMNVSKMFAVWRIEPPWKPVTKKSQGKRHGGGKGSIHHYVTPIRAGQVIIEMGGQCEFEDVYFFLESISKRLPCDALPVSQHILDVWDKEDRELQEKNINPFNFERFIKYNMQNCDRWLSPYDRLWYGKYR